MVTSTPSDEILRAALALPEPDRLKIASELLASVPPPPGVMCEGGPEFFEELKRRSDEYHRDPSTAVDWEVVKKEIDSLRASES